MSWQKIWAESALEDMNFLSNSQAKQVVSEVGALFSDGPPEDARTVSGGTSFIELPCGVEVFFREPGGRVQIFAVSDPRRA